MEDSLQEEPKQTSTVVGRRWTNRMAMLLRQFILILLKNFLLQIRRPIGSLFEIFVPILAIIFIIGFKLAVPAFQPEDKCFVTFPSDPLKIPKYDSVNLEYIYYTPYTDKTRQIASLMDKRINSEEQVAFFRGGDSEEILEYYINDNNDSLLDSYSCFAKGVAVNFENLEGPDIKYTIRLRHDPAPEGSWYTRSRAPDMEPRGARISPNFYFNDGFMQLQKVIEESIIQMVTNKSYNFEVTTRQFPYPKYKRDTFIEAADFILPLIVILSFMYSAGSLVKELVLEKESRMRETMKMMGLSNWVLVSTWFIKQVLFYLIPIIVMTTLLKYGDIFSSSEWFPMFVFMLFFMISGTAFCFLISVWFSSAIIGLMAGIIAWFVSYIPFLVLSRTNGNISFGIKMATCLLSNTCVGYGVSILATLELRQEGITTANFADPVSLDDGFNMGWIVLMFVVDSVIYMLLYWYIDAVRPGKYGVPKPFYFFLKPSFWWGQPKPSKLKPDEEDCLSGPTTDVSAHEQEPTDLEVGISIDQLTKIYNRRNKKRRKVAVDNLSLNMYKGQITALLGHNGAGKTTTMSILTGLFTATTGGAHINGYDIANEMDLIRRSLGICPQHNVLFDRLTVREHLAFFSMLKGLPIAKVKGEVNTMIKDIKLEDKRSVQSQKLSGGMKRKLSVGIALVGGSEIVVLDEPTSGMDPYARRATWDLLVKHKQGRTMLLTTHFMDEADLLGDRIAIMAEGKLKCSGSSLFLKGRYGVGYHMTIVKDPGCDSNAVTELVEQVITGSKQVTNVGSELSYTLPSNSVERFSPLFNYFDEHKSSLRISTFGVSVTTMEEVFIKVGEGTDESLQKRLESKSEETTFTTEQNGSKGNVQQQLSNPEVAAEQVQTPYPFEDHLIANNTTSLNTGIILWLQQFNAMLLKKFLNSYRFWMSLVWQLVLPILFVLFGLLLGVVVPGLNTDEPPRVLTVANSAQSNNRTFFWASSFDGNNSEAPPMNSSVNDLNIKFEDLQKVGITNLINLTDSVQSIKESAGNVTSVEQCCQYKYQILDKFCATRGVGDLVLSDDPLAGVCGEGFGYEACAGTCLGCSQSRLFTASSCTNPRNKGLADVITGGFIAETYCPQAPQVQYSDIHSTDGGLDNIRGPLDDYNVFVTERLLEISGEGINDFFSRYQGGFTMHPLTPHYSVCECNSLQPPSCNRFVPTLDISYNLSALEEAYSAGLNVTNFFDQCFDTFFSLPFPPSCEDWNYEYNWFVDSCIGIGCSRCENNFKTCQQFIGAVSQDYPSAGSTVGVTIWYNNQPYHMAPATLNAFYNVLLKQDEKFKDYTITVTNHPLPRSLSSKINDAQSEFLGFIISSLCLFGLSFMFAGFIITLVQEKDSKAKHLQFVSGVSASSYWLSTFFFDLINALLPSLLAIVLFALFGSVFGLEQYEGWDTISAIFILLILCNWATIPVSYMFSFVLSNPLVAFALMFIIYYFVALVFHMTIFLLNSSNKRDTAETLHHIFLLLPTYALAIGLDDTYTNYEIKSACEQSEISELLCSSGNVTYAENIYDFDKPALGHIYVYLAVEGVVYMSLTLLMEWSFFLPEIFRFLRFITCSNTQKNKSGNMDLEEDDDVADERHRVADMMEDGSGSTESEAVVIANLSKTYTSPLSFIFPCLKCLRGINKLAVNQINLVIPRGECFGLLGVNGAGKTTTFKMLTGDITPSAGTAKLAGFDINTQLRLVQQRIGYCPQFDAVLERLTGRELLTMFARLRGIPEKDIKQAVATEINRLDLVPHANKRCGTYSGGNKRKLSTAVALVGNPPILLLDEPTTGMDPATRRFLWDALTGVIREGRSVILTSHSMEECEALCTRLAIMVNGQFKCLGSIQHLKSKFGSGFIVQVKLKNQFHGSGRDSSISNLHRFMRKECHNCRLIEEHQGLVTYQIPKTSLSWSNLFELLESNKDRFDIEDYSVSQTTLDQVFINFARKQEQP